MSKIIRTATVALSLDVLLKGQLAFLQNYYEVVAVSGQDEHLETVRTREKVRIETVAMQRNISPVKDLISLVHLYRLFKREKPQIVHSITPKAGLLSMIAAKYAGVPVRMHTFTGLIFPSKSGFLQKVLVFMDKVLCYHATHIYPEGLGVKNDLQLYNITSKPLTVIANGNVNGIDTAYFDINALSENHLKELKNLHQVATSDFVFVFVGRLVGDKGINELVEAFKTLAKPNVKLLLVGPYEQELDPLLSQTLDEVKSNPNIVEVGFQQDVRPYFAIADALVFPSYREGFPNVVMQAAAMGLPSIVTDINGCNEIIIEKENGLIIPVKSTFAIHEAMHKMIEDQELYNYLKGNSRKRIVENYDQKVVWNAILQEYKNTEQHV